MCQGFTSPNNSPTENLTLGNADSAIKAESTTSGEFNDQLQSLLGSAYNSPISNASGIQQGFQNFAATGGLSTDQIAAMKNEASDAARSTYSTAGADASRKTAATGGYGDVGSISSSLARQGSNAAANAANNSSASIAGLQTGNELAGLTGQAGLYQLNTQQEQALISDLINNISVGNSGVNQLIGTKAGISENPVAPSLASSIGGGLTGLAGALAKIPGLGA